VCGELSPWSEQAVCDVLSLSTAACSEAKGQNSTFVSCTCTFALEESELVSTTPQHLSLNHNISLNHNTPVQPQGQLISDKWIFFSGQ